MLKDLRRKAALFTAVAMLVASLLVVLPGQAAYAAAKASVKKTPTIASIANLQKTVELDVEVVMPATVTAVMSDKTKKAVAVKWDKVLSSEVDGKYTTNGTVAGYAKKVIFTLTVKAPKMGTIDIPKITDSTLKKPTDIKLGIGKKEVYMDESSQVWDETLLSVYWTLQSTEADEYAVVLYDQYKRIVYNGGIVLNPEDIEKKQGCNMLHLENVKNLTISAITITPIKSTEEGRMTGDRSKNGVGETAVFECSIRITVKTAKPVIMTVKPNDGNPEAYDLSFSGKFAPQKYIDLRSDHKYGYAVRGDFSGKDGTISIIYVNPNEYKELYEDLSAKLSLMVYSDAVADSANKGAFTITTYPVDFKDNPSLKAVKAIEGVYTNGSKKVVISVNGPKPDYFSGNIHALIDLDNTIFDCRSAQFDGSKKITDTTQNADGPVVTIELVLDGDTIHYTRTFHQENNKTEKIDFKRTKEDALSSYEKYCSLLYSK